MNEQVSRENLKKLIALGKEAKVLEKLIAMSKGQSTEMQKLIILQSNRYQKFRKKRLAGTIDQASANVMVAQISSDLFEILDSFKFPGEEEPLETVSISTGLGKENNKLFRPRSFASLGVLLVISGVLILASILFYNKELFKPGLKTQDAKTTEGGQATTKGGGLNEQVGTVFRLGDWLGTWEANMETDNEQMMQGSLTFTKEMGRFQFKDDGLSNSMILNQITFNQNKQKMVGIWDMEDAIGNPGTFMFLLSPDKKSFAGTYTMGENKDETFFWKGKKYINNYP